MTASLDEHLAQLESLRKELHSELPELALQEHRTSARIEEYLKEHTSADISRIAGTGILARFDGKDEGETILVRADIDALPIEEAESIPHRSKNPGVSHKCGHDGHTTILIALALLLDQEPPKRGTVFLLWQPAEETGEGAASVLASPEFNSITPDRVLALHNLPGHPFGEVLVRNWSFTAHVETAVIKLKGTTAHAAEPEHGNNPALALAAILQIANRIDHPVPDDDKEFFLVTPVFAHLGSEDHGISAGDAELHLTMRAWTTDTFERKYKDLEQRVRDIAEAQKLEISIERTACFHANQNDPATVDLIQAACEELGMTCKHQEFPFKWGEDFGLFTERFKGAMFGIGAGVDRPALHRPDYDFPDGLIGPAAQLFHTIIKRSATR